MQQLVDRRDAQLGREHRQHGGRDARQLGLLQESLPHRAELPNAGKLHRARGLIDGCRYLFLFFLLFLCIIGRCGLTLDSLEWLLFRSQCRSSSIGATRHSTNEIVINLNLTLCRKLLFLDSMTLLKLHSHHVESEKAGKEVQKHQHDDSNSSRERAATKQRRRNKTRKREKEGKERVLHW